ncbi:MAG: prepilin-type N-terminal cleavage/methylation domain-containing protein [Peptococcaceae bacterium]|nr:prepilin-type N-terminal cleavage/methylation domain-containing protein [Peptococcaceae bacterium]
MKKRAKGFTLLELIVVLLIVGIMGALISVKASPNITQAQTLRIDSDLEILLVACEQASMAGETIDTQAALVRAGFLQEALESPVHGYEYAVEAAPGEARAALKKGDEVYEKGDYLAEKISTRLYLR